MIPEETQIEGNPQEVIGDDQLTEIAEVSEGPTEEVSLGNPEEETIQVEENLQIAESTESAQLNPSIAISDGKPEEGIAFQSVAEDEEDIIAPQESIFAGSPELQDQIDESLLQEEIEIAEIEPVAPARTRYTGLY